MKYFFLTDGWVVGRVWAADGLWNETAWRRQPEIQRLNLCLIEEREKLWLYRVEDAVLTIEVRPLANASASTATAAIGQVVLKRLISAEQVLDRLATAETTCQLSSIESVAN